MARRLMIAVLAACALLAATACGSSGSATDSNPNTLTEMDYYNTDPGLTALPKLLQTCGRQSGVTITRQVVPDLRTKLLQLAGSHAVPDLVLLDNPDLQQLAATGALADLGAAGVTTNGIYPNIVAAGQYNGKLYGLAPGVNALALFYNTKLFTAAGLRPPKTWSDLTADAAKLTTGQQHGIGFAVPATEEGSFQFESFFLTAGADLRTLNSPQAVSALRLLANLVSAGSAPKDVLSWTQANVEEQFANGSLAMMVNGPWQLPELAKANMTDFGVVPIPVPDAGGTSSSALGGEVWAAGNGAKTGKAAAVIKCLTSATNSLSWSKLVDYVPADQAAARQLAISDPQLTPFVDEIGGAKGRTAELGANYPKYSQALWTAVQSAIAGQSTPQAALDEAQQQASAS
ncbi:MAG TPA: extracellular solute-binding protein [Pseudonocardiaceae bacterium]|jgi:multiple sugar transport system substrate-binding protein|nr:extracellular solute-binding protein [Pseudonocardiaceae bacterium]